MFRPDARKAMRQLNGTFAASAEINPAVAL
jgi:hypothetical protein